MNSLQIARILKRNSKTKRSFKGVFSADNGPVAEKRADTCWKLRLPCKEKYFPYCFIANTDPAGTSGSHWIAIFVNNPLECDFFDSLGEKPNEYLIKYLHNFQKVNVNMIALQSPLSDSCGHYCIYFLINRCSGKKFEHIVRNLIQDPLRDLHVKMYVNTYIKD